MSRPKSSKGFLAIDIDGTALVQKIDKNPAYGLLHSQSNMRLALISYIQQAQQEGYDIIILTARPRQIERFLGIFNLGTKSTQSIVDNLNEYGVDVKGVERSPTGLKGAKMQQILEQYPSGATGMLFDDQLKQVNDVTQLNNDYLIAYDINSKKDLDRYVHRVNLSANNIFHPDLIIARLLASHEKLKSLQTGCEQLNGLYSQEKKLAQDVIHELCIRAFEAEYRDYQPEIDWINTTTRHMQVFLDKLNAHQRGTDEEVEKATKDIFGTKKLERVIPNSNCDLVVKQFLQEGARSGMIDNLNHADKVRFFGQCADICGASKGLINNSLDGRGVIKSIKSVLAKAPIIGALFQTEKRRITDKIDNSIASAAYETIVNEYKTIKVDFELEPDSKKNNSHG